MFCESDSERRLGWDASAVHSAQHPRSLMTLRSRLMRVSDWLRRSPSASVSPVVPMLKCNERRCGSTLSGAAADEEEKDEVENGDREGDGDDA